jgi:hypothetical protein
MAALVELAPQSVLFDSGKEGLEISGVAAVGEDLLIVSDDADQHFLYKLVHKKKEDRVKFTPAYDLTALKGWDKVQAAMKEAVLVPQKGRRLDLEGLAACPAQHTVYIANEDVRQILVLDTEAKSIAVAAIDFTGFKPLFDGGANAGFEGVAADCAHGTLYVAKERDPRRIFKVDANSWKVVDDFDIPYSERQGQKVIDFKSGAGLMDLSPDIGDLAFDGGYLYAIERNTYEITKVDPATKQVVDRVSYYQTEKPLYETHEPFGLAEALHLTPTEIWLGLDNNNSPATHYTAKTYGYKGSGGAFLVFPRPKGF